ncbi:hypothetical protein FQN57_004132 [Myotisia sp. PD_48]|nr:hypothetical protein FQN57_004132 [Myotisia sp. PD_48]
MATATIDSFFPPIQTESRKRKVPDGQSLDPECDNYNEQASAPSSNIRRGYTIITLANLAPGPKRVTFTARIVNIYDWANSYADSSSSNSWASCGNKWKKSNLKPKSSNPARGCLKMVLKDTGGLIQVSLWYSDIDYALRLGMLVTVWTTHISPFKRIAGKNPSRGENYPSSSSSSPIKSSPSAAALRASPGPTPGTASTKVMTSIFPERDRGCFIEIHQGSDEEGVCRMPLGYKPGRPCKDLDTLGYAQEKAALFPGNSTKVLVYVSRIGTLREAQNGREGAVQTLDVGIADRSGEAILGLYGSMMISALQWVPGQTVLLVSDASWKSRSRAYISSQTCVEVDPDIVEAEWLRNLAVSQSELLNPDFPAGAFDIESWEASKNKIKFTLADIVQETLPTIGSLLDETGMISCSIQNAEPCDLLRVPGLTNKTQQPRRRGNSPLLWGPETMDQLLECSLTDLWIDHEGSEKDILSSLQFLESKLMYSRFTAVFGWDPANNGKLAIWKIVK